jgi:CheY-like chemotaxis protein
MTMFTPFTSTSISAKVMIWPPGGNHDQREKNTAKVRSRMLQAKNFDAPSVQRQKVLLVGAEPSVQSLISAFLATMGSMCTVASSKEEAPAILEREVFDAVLLDYGRWDGGADEFILRIKQIRPSVADRIVVITNGTADRGMMELIERHDLFQVSQEGLVQQLWATLQELFVSRRPWQLPVRRMGIPQIIFDSFRSPMTAGVRSLSPGARQLGYQHKSTIIDLSIEFLEGSDRISLAGQVLDAERKGMNDGLSVLLVSGFATLVRTATNQFGEFHLEFESAENVSLEIRVGERSWVLVPLGKMDWAGKRMSVRRTES